MREAITNSVQVDVLNLPTGRYGFDVRYDNARSREIIAAIVDFLKRDLLEMRDTMRRGAYLTAILVFAMLLAATAFPQKLDVEIRAPDGVPLKASYYSPGSPARA